MAPIVLQLETQQRFHTNAKFTSSFTSSYQDTVLSSDIINLVEISLHL